MNQKLEKLALENNSPCVTISLNTHRTHPENAQDEIILKNLLKEAEERVLAEFEKRPMASLLEKIATVLSEIDMNYHLDSLHIFLSNDTQEVIRLAWPIEENSVQISDSFAIRPLIQASTQSEEYLILLLSQGGTQLYKALNGSIVEEIEDDGFPFAESQHYLTNSDRASDAKQVDNMVREFLNEVDKALVKVHNKTGMRCVVICTEDNHSRLMQVADKPDVYFGYAPIDYNNTATHHIAKQGWEIVSTFQKQGNAKAIGEMKEAVAKGLVLTDLQEIFQAAMEGRGDVLIINKAFSQSVVMTSDRTFNLITDVTIPNAIDDITNRIAWDVLSKKGRVIFTTQEQLKDLGDIVLKTRY